MKTEETQQPPAKKRWHILETLATVVIIVALVGSLAVLFQLRQASHSSQGSKGKTTSAAQASNVIKATPKAIITAAPKVTATPMLTPTAQPAPPTTTPTAQPKPPTITPTAMPAPPTSVMLSVSAPGIPPTTQSTITIPAGTTVTITVIPDHSLLPFHTFTMGIYATDPYGFSELQYCTYPNTNTCSYTIAYSSSENTDYTKGTHTFKAFLGDIGGRILYNSSGITITWS